MEIFCSGDILIFKQTFAPNHFAVYAGDNKIIHYQKLEGQPDMVIEESIQEFQRREGYGYCIERA